VIEGAKLYNFSSSNNAQKWDSYVDKHPHGSIFHLSNWQNIVQATFHHHPSHLIAENGTGDTQGILPLFIVKSRIFGKMLVSTPQAAYGGILADNETIAEVLLAKAQEIARNENVEFLELRDFQSGLNSTSLQTKDLYVTFRQELFEDPEKNFLLIPRKTRAECRAGIKHDLEFRVNEIGADGFFYVYSRSVRDLGTPVFSRKLFSNCINEFGNNCRIYSVHWKGKLISAVLTFFYKGEVIPYYGGSIREYNHLGSNNFMYWMLIKHGCENGYRVFDFGRSKKGTGSFDFKKRWGMAMIDLPYRYALVRRQSLPDTSPLNPKFALAIRLWSKLPIPVANTLGPFISKNFI
jgi:FemAB-related protein (PEP-CTERM system-associated)